MLKEQFQKLKTLRRGEYFGEYSFLTEMASDLKGKSSKHCKLLYLKKSDYL